jgi:two-component sensor histidine kinase
MDWLLHLIPRQQPLLVRYGATAAMVALAYALRFALQGRGGPYGFILFIPPILAAAILFDRGSGFLALMLSAIVSAVALDWNLNADVHVSALASFIVVGILLVVFGEGFHRALERAQLAERAKDLLLQEMSHRIKNTFAMILSLIGLQARQAQPDMRTALEAMARRVRVLASIHDHLRTAPREDHPVNLAQYLTELGASLQDSVRELRPITVLVKAEAASTPAAKALAIGLIVNELVTNALKHAFDGEHIGHIEVRLACAADQLELSVSDNGRGCSESAPKGLGRQLVDLLVAQLGGSLMSQNTEPGCCVSVLLPGTVTT